MSIKHQWSYRLKREKELNFDSINILLKKCIDSLKFSKDVREIRFKYQGYSDGSTVHYNLDSLEIYPYRFEVAAKVLFFSRLKAVEDIIQFLQKNMGISNKFL